MLRKRAHHEPISWTTSWRTAPVVGGVTPQPAPTIPTTTLPLSHPLGTTLVPERSEVTLLAEHDGIERLLAFIDQWPVGMQLTTRGIQVGAGIPDLAQADQAAAALRALGLLEMQAIGATHLWRRCEYSAAVMTPMPLVGVGTETNPPPVIPAG
jgi:hypothetical protein